MSDTPRLRSAFPNTPQRYQKAGGQNDFGTPTRKPSDRLPERKIVIERKPAPQDSNDPLIPFNVIDAPSQRLYVVGFCVALNAWRIYEYWTSRNELDSTWLFLKWLAIDGVFLFGLPGLRIPWLEWAFSTTVTVFIIHAVANAFLMFQIPIPIVSWLVALAKLAYDRELSISETRVKPADILHNSSLILGKQIIHILPEGSAVLNPEREPFCLDSQHSSVSLPIRINQTTPTLIELLRFDFDTGQNETVVIPAKQLKQLKRQADKGFSKADKATPRVLHYPIKKTGLYQLQKVVDESKLEVRRRRPLDTLVVDCPKASVRSSPAHKCKGELSDLILEVEGTPPLKIKYSRRINQVDHGFSFQSIQPEHLPFLPDGENQHGPVADQRNSELAWARTQKIDVPLNESLSTGGEWVYSIEEVHDACGNVANYSSDQYASQTAKPAPQYRYFSVHERPRVSLTGCNDQKFLEVAKEDSTELPVRFHPVGRTIGDEAPYTLSYTFTSQTPNEDARESPPLRQVTLKSADHKPRIKEPGWYSITSVSSQFCSGEVLEPTSCFLHNPPEPELVVKSEKIFDKCANHSTGLLVDLDLTGTPPFRIRYTIEHPGGTQTRVHTVDALRDQLDLTPSAAGHYRYQFLDIADRVYETRSLKDKVPALEQDVKPLASARFVEATKRRKACFGEPVSVDVSFVGEAPFTLQYELIHNGKRAKHELKSDANVATLTTDRLINGGEYTLALTSVKDKSNCRRPLNEQVKIEARSKKPHVSFGQIDEKRSILALEARKVELPIRLSGESPWTIKYRNLEDPSLPVITKQLWKENSLIPVNQRGRYEIIDIQDATCPGSVDQSANIFEVSWIPRPQIVAVDGISVESTDRYVKNEICEGDEDGLELKFVGSPPYSVKYEQQRKAGGGSSSPTTKSFTAALNSAFLQMDTVKPGDYTYKFIELDDNLYRHDSKKLAPLVVSQRVNARPSARFESPGHIYGFCKEEATGEEVIPIVLQGTPPFSLEISIKHHSSAKAEIVSVPNIPTNKHNLHIPRRHLELGQHVVSVHKVRDGRGCQQTTEADSSSVRVAVSDVPNITPLESKVDYCVGERISYLLSGHAPFEVFYTFDGVKRKAVSPATSFRRIAEKPGEFTITAVGDGASGKCKASKNITKIIRELPSVKISHGQTSVVDIHEGGEAEIQFEFWGTPPFEFTYTRSSNAAKGKKSQVLDTKHDISYEYTKTVIASDEGTYEVVAIKDKFCSSRKAE